VNGRQPRISAAIGRLTDHEKNDERRRVGLCADCRYARRVVSERGSAYYLCLRSATEPTFPKYPELPVVICRGYEELRA
jgi:hypothetical protein